MNAADQKQRQRDMLHAVKSLTADPNMTAKELAAKEQWSDNHARSILYALETVGKAICRKVDGVWRWMAVAPPEPRL